MTHVERLHAQVTLDDPEPTLERARTQAAAGDESWEQWEAEYLRGEALIVRLDVTLEVSGKNGPEVVEATNRGVFLQTDAQPPKVEQQVAELVGKDFPALARELEGRDHDLDAGELYQMFVHVELGQDVLRSLTDARSRRHDPRSDARLAQNEGAASDQG